MRSFIALLLLSASSLSSACIYERSSGDAHWSYEDSNGPVLWHTLSHQYNLCSSGTRQSPINIDNAISTIEGSEFDYPARGDFVLTNNGHTIEAVPIVDGRNNYTAILGGNEYKLKAFHFHTPSEHRVEGVAFPLEAHFVHTNIETGAIAVFGIFFEVTADQGESFFHTMSFSDLADEGDSQTVKDIKLLSIINTVSTSKVYHYSGSLTTPPCSEMVNWFVAEKPLLISVKQYKSLYHSVGFNSRFTQGKLGERNLLNMTCTAEL